MRLFWWLQLHLLLFIQLLEPGKASYKFCAEAILTFKIASGSPRQSIGRIGRYPCLRQCACSDCYKLNVISWFTEISSLPPQARAVYLSSVTPNFLPVHTATQLQAKLYIRSRNRIAATIDGDSDVPTLTPLSGAHVRKPRKQLIAAIIGSVGAVLLVIIVVVLVYVCLMRVKRFIRRRSETTSSAPSPPIDLERVSTCSFTGAGSPYEAHGARQITVVELEHATSDFSQSTIIGEGGFGFVFKGLLLDGSIVAIKRGLHAPTQDFFHKVRRIANVHHKHLVKLIGYCQDNDQQLLVYEYLPNGNVGKHLYNSEGSPIGKLNMRQRLLIALGAAKGLEHLHGLVPPLVHMHFRTTNVLVDENFVAKVSDYGLAELLTESNRAGSSSATDCFLDPELNASKNPSKRSDVYSFGIFLLELISGREASSKNQSNTHENLVLQAKEGTHFEDFVDRAIGEGKCAAEKAMKLALWCVDGRERRPSMGRIVQELEQIQGREFGHLDVELGENIGAVTLGSELFQ